MATEALLVRAVESGGDRQHAHEVIRTHSIAAARAMKHDGSKNDMLDRLARDPAFPVSSADLRDSADPKRFVGRAPEQVDEFLADVVQPILAAAGDVSIPREEVRV